MSKLKILFLTLTLPDEESNTSSMYLDLINEFKNRGHSVTVVTTVTKGVEGLKIENGINVLRVKALQTQEIKNLIKKGVGYALLPLYFKRAYKRYIGKTEFDWTFMPTPPITLVDFVSYVRKVSGSRLYLILRDIHPQSAASIGLIRNKYMYQYLAKRAYKGYQMADLIGCMSAGNIDFIKDNYPHLDIKKLVLLYNWQKSSETIGDKSDAHSHNKLTSLSIRAKLNLDNKIIALFGGNIGYGQRVENIYNLATYYKNREELCFLVIGKGVMKDKLKEMVCNANLRNVIFLDFMPRTEYLSLIANVDIGLISINENYKVPTCPSKAVSYMSLGIPIFAMINPNNDYGQIIENAGAGFWAVGGESSKAGYKKFEQLIESKKIRNLLGENGRRFFLNNLTSEIAYKTVIRQINESK